MALRENQSCIITLNSFVQYLCVCSRFVDPSGAAAHSQVLNTKEKFFCHAFFKIVYRRLVHAIYGYAMAYSNQMLVPLLKLRSQVILIQKYSKDYMHTSLRTKN